MNLSPAWQKHFRALQDSKAIFLLLLLMPVAAHAQAAGSPFDTGFTALQTLFTGTIAKVASLIAIVIGGYGFAHGEPGAKKARAWLQERASRCLQSTSFPGSGEFSQSFVFVNSLTQ